MDRIKELAEQFHAFEPRDNATFQRRARILQSLWRQEQGYPMGEHNGRKLGSALPMPWAEESLANFLDDTIRQVVREEVLDKDRAKGKLFGRPRLFNNLLSSQPLAFNLFAHLGQDLPLATKVLAKLTDGRCHEVTGIEFEHSPGRGDNRYTGDRSAFDVYVTFDGTDGQHGFIGIEVKYHEDLGQSPSEHKPRYDEVAHAMGCFRPEAMPCLRNKPLQQIWRDHLLAGSLQLTDGFNDGLFVFLSPKDNDACNEAVASYLDCLTHRRSFEHWTLEAVVEVARQFAAEPWVEALYSRYLDFAKIEDRYSA